MLNKKQSTVIILNRILETLEIKRWGKFGLSDKSGDKINRQDVLTNQQISQKASTISYSSQISSNNEIITSSLKKYPILGIPTEINFELNNQTQTQIKLKDSFHRKIKCTSTGISKSDIQQIRAFSSDNKKINVELFRSLTSNNQNQNQHIKRFSINPTTQKHNILKNTGNNIVKQIDINNHLENQSNFKIMNLNQHSRKSSYNQLIKNINANSERSLDFQKQSNSQENSKNLKEQQKVAVNQEIDKNDESANRSLKGFMQSNPKKVNQDSMFLSHKMHDDQYDSIYLLGVMDGHGSFGHLVSQFVENNFLSEYQQILNQESNYSKRFYKMTENINSKLKANRQINCQYSGTTMIVLLLLFKNNKLRIVSCNCEDSRAIMGLVKSTTELSEQNSKVTVIPQNQDKSHLNNNQKQNENIFQVLELSRDHKPELPDEAARILSMNGRIDSYRDEQGNQLGPMRLWLKNENIPGVAMSRSIGDNLATSIGVSWEPEIKEFLVNFSITDHSDKSKSAEFPPKSAIDEQIEAERGFILIASDGVWEFLRNEEIVRGIRKFYLFNDLKGASDWLQEEAQKMDNGQRFCSR